MELGTVFAVGGLLLNVFLNIIGPQAIDDTENDWLSESPLKILPEELLSHVASYLTTAEDIWPFYFTCRRFQQLIAANETQHSVVKSPMWIHHYLMNVAEEIGSEEEPLLDYVSIHLKHLLYGKKDIIQMSRKFTEPKFCEEHCALRLIAREAIIVPDQSNPFIPDRAKTIKRPLVDTSIRNGYIWVPEDPENADMFKEFKHVGEIVAALKNNFQGFAPHLVHKYILPVRSGSRQLTSEERDLFTKYGTYLVKGISDYLHYVYLGKYLENTSQISSSDATHRAQEIDAFLASLGLPPGTTSHRLKAANIRNYNRAKPILCVAAHWNMNLERIIGNYPREALANPNEIEEVLATGVLQEPVTFQGILDSYTLH